MHRDRPRYDSAVWLHVDGLLRVEHFEELSDVVGGSLAQSVGLDDVDIFDLHVAGETKSF
jgi:hypothetical protein